MNQEVAKAIDNITRAAEAIESCYWEDELRLKDAERLCQAIIQDVATIMFYNRNPSNHAPYAQNPGE
jgi:hypothetical protein